MLMKFFLSVALTSTIVIVIIGISLHFIFKDVLEELSYERKTKDLDSETKDVSSFVNQRGVSRFILEFPGQTVIPNIEVTQSSQRHSISK